jgi:predicted TIM-barrel fold metal-dependent hydrolase
MKRGFRVMDSDFHMMEPPDLWDRYLEDQFKPLAPKVTANPLSPIAKETVAVNGKLPVSQSDRNAAETRGNLRLRALQRSPHYARAIERGYDSATHVEAMDIEGVDVGILYSTRGRQVLAIDNLDASYAAALARAYNNWAYDYCQYNPARLRLAAQLDFHDVDLAVREARRAVEELGAVAVVASPNPVNGRHLHDPFFEPLWNELERLGVPLGLHPTGVSSLQDNIARRFVGHAASGPISHAVRNPIESTLAFASLAMGGVLERHPELTVVFLESCCGWLPWWLERLDGEWEKLGPGCEVKLAAKPSEYFFRQCYIATDPDEEGLNRVIDEIGDNRIVVSTDYPHDDGLFPLATETFLALPDVTEDSKRKILWDNCARLYRISSAADALQRPSCT